MTRGTIGRDWKLSTRMFATMAMLAAVYIAFLAFLSSLGVGVGLLVVIAGVMLGAQYFFSDRLAMLGMGAKEVSAEEAPELHAIIGRLAQLANIPKPRVAISDMPIANAFATGRSPKRAVIAVTRVLMEGLEPAELEAVLSHEISHVVHRDVAVMTLASFFAMLAFFIMRSFLWMGIFGGGDDEDSGGGSMVVVWLVSMVVYLVSQVLILALGRYRELAADRGGAQLTGHPSHLASALVKISGAMERMPQRDMRQVETMNAFFIVPTKVKEIFSTHPSLDRRLRQLAQIQQELERS
ncbi:MAG TPA: zinc metalloprotease HtpX [Actinomycetota bacterium]|nr:zinc metalloprotease HtpX [Actinomycetota bacterium]